MLVVSDLHQGEGGVPYDPAAIRTPFDVVVVAGDCAGRLTSSLRWLGDRFAGTSVVYVPGNHDYYRDGRRDGFTMEDELDAGRELADRLGIHLLSDGEARAGGVRFLGATLWTDLRSGFHTDRSHAVGEARRGMNDYRLIHRRSSTRRSRRLSPIDTLAYHGRSREFLSHALASDRDVATVVVTHHAPSMRSLPDPTAALNQCYASDMDSLVGDWQPDLWIHGHVHVRADYRIGTTRVVCNPSGYRGETSGFDPGMILQAGRAGSDPDRY
nr:metallophosphoesterase [Aureimonas jatrophae]